MNLLCIRNVQIKIISWRILCYHILCISGNAIYTTGKGKKTFLEAQSACALGQPVYYDNGDLKINKTKSFPQLDPREKYWVGYQEVPFCFNGEYNNVHEQVYEFNKRKK